MKPSLVFSSLYIRIYVRTSPFLSPLLSYRAISKDMSAIGSDSGMLILVYLRHSRPLCFFYLTRGLDRSPFVDSRPSCCMANL